MPAERECRLPGWGGASCWAFQEKGAQGRCEILNDSTYNSISALRKGLTAGDISPKDFICHMETYLEDRALDGCVEEGKVRTMVMLYIAEARGMLASSPR